MIYYIVLIIVYNIILYTMILCGLLWTGRLSLWTLASSIGLH